MPFPKNQTPLYNVSLPMSEVSTPWLLSWLRIRLATLMPWRPSRTLPTKMRTFLVDIFDVNSTLFSMLIRRLFDVLSMFIRRFIDLISILFSERSFTGKAEGTSVYTIDETFAFYLKGCQMLFCEWFCQIFGNILFYSLMDF